MQENLCHTCKYFGLSEVERGNVQSVCRRYPMSVHAMMEFSKLDPSQARMNVVCLFPSILPDGQGCGEYELKEELCRKEGG